MVIERFVFHTFRSYVGEKKVLARESKAGLVPGFPPSSRLLMTNWTMSFSDKLLYSLFRQDKRKFRYENNLNVREFGLIAETALCAIVPVPTARTNNLFCIGKLHPIHDGCTGSFDGINHGQ